jgi:hypothetical protein
VPPRNSKHANLKVTAVSLSPNERLLGIGNILGSVNIIRLDFTESGRAQRLVHSCHEHQVGRTAESSALSHHQQDCIRWYPQAGVRCLAWSADGLRLYSGCDGGRVVETKLPMSAVEEPSAEDESRSGKSGLGRVRLLGAKSLINLFEAPSSRVIANERSECLQVGREGGRWCISSMPCIIDPSF